MYEFAVMARKNPKALKDYQNYFEVGIAQAQFLDRNKY
jgi:hypothetical protein